MTVGYSNYNYSAPVYATQNAQQTQQTQKSAKKSNKGAIAASATVAAGLALTAYAASKGKNITGQDKLIANLKAGFSQIKDDVVCFAKKQINKLIKTGNTAQEAIKPNNVETGLSIYVNTAANEAAEATSSTTNGILNSIKELKDSGIEKLKQLWNKLKPSEATSYITAEGVEITRFADNSYRGIKV